MSKKRSNRFYETFRVKQKTDRLERFWWGFDSVVYIIISFYAGLEFYRSKSLLWFLLFIGILVYRFQNKRIKEVTKKVFL